MVEINSVNGGAFRGSQAFGDQPQSAKLSAPSDVKPGTQVSDFLVARAEIDAKSSNTKLPAVTVAQRAEQMRPYVPGPAEALGGQIKDALGDLLEWDVGTKNALKDYAQMVSSTSQNILSDMTSNDEDDEFGFGELTKAMRDLHRMQQNQVLMMLDLIDRKGAAEMISKAFKGANTSFNKLISG